MDQGRSGDMIPQQQQQQQQQQQLQQQNDVLSGKIMLSALAALFTSILIVLFFHLYVRWQIRRAHRHRHLTLLIASEDPSPNRNPPAPSGLDPDLLRSLPVTVRSPSDAPIECAVCLSEIEDGESFRILPKCRHGFHVECIDMWFFSHATCPLCRGAVEAPPVPAPESPVVCNACGAASSSEVVAMVAIGSPATRIDDLALGFGMGIESPSVRIATLKRLLSRDRSLYSGTISDADLERGDGLELLPHPSSSQHP